VWAGSVASPVMSQVFASDKEGIALRDGVVSPTMDRMACLRQRRGVWGGGGGGGGGVGRVRVSAAVGRTRGRPTPS